MKRVTKNQIPLLIILLFFIQACEKDLTSPDENKTGTVEDIDGHVYKTIKIGTQWWMAENLKVTRYRNGDIIPNVIEDSLWRKLSYGAFCAYDNEQMYVDTYGLLYNWYAISDNRGVAPDGWHVPTDEEWKQLEIFLGMNRSEADAIGGRGSSSIAASKLAGDASLWPDGELTFYPEFGASGFSALPGGFRTSGAAHFDAIGEFAFFWSSSEFSGYKEHVWRRHLNWNNSNISRDLSTKETAYSVRCVKD